MKRRLICCGSRTLLAFFVLHARSAAWAATYEVGPGKPLSAIGEVPWESLQPGDTVLIHWRLEPYQEKWVICRQGTANAPITVRGVASPAGQLPIIDGNGATTRAQLNYWGGVRSVIKIGGAHTPPDTMPQYIVIENLDIRSARPPFKFTEADRKTQTYQRNAAAIRVEKGEHLTIRNCILRDSGNGLLIGSNEQQAARDILIEGNYIYDNGNPRSAYEHNVYTEAIGITYQFNRLGPLRTSCPGNNLKDRSAGLVVRYNWIEGGDKQLDLVDAEDSHFVRDDPGYRSTFVYGNILIEPAGAGHPYIVHYGGDSATRSHYRKGTLYFYHNTIVSHHTGATTLFQLSSDAEQCDFRNNLVSLTAPKGTLALVENRGRLDLSHNGFSHAWRKRSRPDDAAALRDDGTSVIGAKPGFVDLAAKDFRLVTTSPCRDAGAVLDGEPFRSHPVERQYVKHQSGENRSSDGKPDIGAYEINAGGGR